LSTVARFKLHDIITGIIISLSRYFFTILVGIVAPRYTITSVILALSCMDSHDMHQVIAGIAQH